jgi:hypothetical protein
MTKDEVMVCKHALMTLESALTMLSNSNIPNSELMPILNMFSSVQEDLVKLYAEDHAKKENTKKRERSSESSRCSTSYESESMGEFFAHSTDFDGFGELWDARDWDARGF